jgi:hypothetical protein
MCHELLYRVHAIVVFVIHVGEIDVSIRELCSYWRFAAKKACLLSLAL